MESENSDLELGDRHGRRRQGRRRRSGGGGSGDRDPGGGGGDDLISLEKLQKEEGEDDPGLVKIDREKTLLEAEMDGRR
jgi:hypothetical protein